VYDPTEAAVTELLPRKVPGELRGEVADCRLTVMQVTWSLVAGGAEMYALKIASGLDRRHYRTAMCGLDQGGALEEEIRRLGIGQFIMHRKPGIELGLMWRMFRLFRTMKVDVAHTHHFNQLFYSALAAKLTGAKIIHTEHSIEAYKKRRLRIALRLLSLLCDQVIAIGSDGERVLREQVGIPARKLRVIRAGVDIKAFNESKDEARRALDLGPEHRVAAIVARLYPEKNHKLLLEAFAEVVKKLPQARLLIAGDGIEREAIAREIGRLGLHQQVRMLGVRRDVAGILAASDVFVLCSDREGLPIAVLEAMAAARPVVATAVGDLPLVVKDGDNGLLVPPNDPAALAKALLSMLMNDARALAMGLQGRRMVAENYALEGMIREHASLYGSR
jgi:glycosyltransferase involved in cell wall biosynthesis